MKPEETAATTTEEKATPIKDAGISSSRPLSLQVDKLLATLPAEEKAEDEIVEKPDKPKIIDEAKADEADEKIESEAALVDQTLPIPGIDSDTPTDELPPVAKYIMDNLPDIEVTGHQGEGAADKVFRVKRLEDLPDDFEFASRRVELAFMRAEAAQEMNARDLFNRYKQEEANANVRNIREQDVKIIQSDIASLQKDGILERFKYAADDPRFSEDPAVIEANAIYKIWSDTNESYIKSGRVNKITYLDAADKYFASKYRAEQKTAAEVKAAEKKEEPSAKKPEMKPVNQERQRVASRVSASQGAEPGKERYHLKPGASFNDILRAYKQGMI